MAVSAPMPPALKFAQGFLPVFLFALLWWNWRASAPPPWLLALVFLLLVLASLLVVRVVWGVMQRADTLDDD